MATVYLSNGQKVLRFESASKVVQDIYRARHQGVFYEVDWGSRGCMYLNPDHILAVHDGYDMVDKWPSRRHDKDDDI